MFFNQTVTALVPIKENSERVEGKNFRLFAGKPLYHHIIETLDRTYAIDSIIVNTDSLRIMHEAPALSPKVKVHERPPELIGDMISTNRIFDYDLQQTDSDIYVQTHATNPLLRPETISDALRVFHEQEEYDSLFSVTPHQSRFYSSTGRAVNHDPEQLLRTQDLSPLYEENSCLYVFTKYSFDKDGRRIGLTPYMFPTPAIESVDIDDEFTFRLAEMLAFYSLKQ